MHDQGLVPAAGAVCINDVRNRRRDGLGGLGRRRSGASGWRRRSGSGYRGCKRAGPVEHPGWG